jgi:hypothetical protein
MADSSVRVMRHGALPARRVDELRRASHDLQKLETSAPTDLLKIAEAINLRRSSTLLGCLGGAVGSAIGIALPGMAMGGLMLPAIILGGPAGVFAGVAIALLAWRGPRRLRLEWNIERLKLFLEEMDVRVQTSNAQIEALPASAPQQIIDEMWHAHRRLIVQRAEAEAEIADTDS